jgi:phage replication initiation protein
MDAEFGQNVLLDYLSFTVPFSEKMLEKLAQGLEVGEIKENGFGGMGYVSSAFILDGGRFFWHEDRPEMGIHVRLNPASLSLTGFTALGLLNYVLDKGGKVTRLDVAFDDMAGLLDMQHMYEKLLSGAVTTRFRKVARVQGAELGTNRKIGDTINVGARASQAFVRIYDKKREQESKGKDVSLIENWTRVELELKSQKAHMFARLLTQTATSKDQGTAAELCAKLLYGLLDFKEVNPADDNKTRWDTSPWWLKFVQAESKLRLSIPPSEKTLENAMSWVRLQVAPTLAMIVLSLPDVENVSGYDFIMNSIKDGEERLSNEQKKRLILYNEQQKAKQKLK